MVGVHIGIVAGSRRSLSAGCSPGSGWEWAASLDGPLRDVLNYFKTVSDLMLHANCNEGIRGPMSAVAPRVERELDFTRALAGAIHRQPCCRPFVQRCGPRCASLAQL